MTIGFELKAGGGDKANLLAGINADERVAFAQVFGGAHQGAQMHRLLGDWSSMLGDANDDWSGDGPTLAARAWQLVQNDPHARALVETVVLGVLGSDGMEFRSLFQVPNEGEPGEITVEEHATRRAIQNAIARASLGTQLDAGDALSRRDLLAQLVVSMCVTGDGYAVRVWRPRPGAYQGTRWRVVDAARVSNPDDKANTATLVNGHELDDDGCTIAIWVRDRMPSSMSYTKPRWTRIEVYNPDGSRNVMHLFRALRAGQVRGFSWFAPLMVLAQHLSKLFEAFVVAKRAQACQPAVVKTDNAAEAEAAARAGAWYGPNMRYVAGMVAFTSRDNDIVFPTMSFTGADYQAFIDCHLRAFAASWGYPFQFVLQQLTDANLASAQVSLDQVDKVNTALQDLVIIHACQPMDEWIVREELARGRLRLPAGVEELCDVMVGTYRRPRRPDANKQRTREAAAAFLAMGGSPSTAFAEMGYDWQDECEQRAQDLAFAAAKGVPVLPAPKPADEKPAEDKPQDETPAKADEEQAA
jgi:lambda family phage portal protein